MGKQYGAVIRLWESAWEQFIPFLDYDLEIRTVICSTNAIESLNARYRRAVKARGHFPTEQAAIKCLYLVTRSLDPTGTGRTRWTMRWKARPERVRYHLRRPLPGPRDLLTKTAGNTVNEIDPGSWTAIGGPVCRVSGCASGRCYVVVKLCVQGTRRRA